jgi:DNA primase
MIRDLAIKIKPLIESFGYNAFPKTSGKKGVHIFCPVVPENSFDEVFEAAKEIGEEIVNRLGNVTLRISREKRTDKTLIDIYRNHTLQSMSLPYGMRATDKANVSMPLTWEMLEKTESPEEYNINTVPRIIKNIGDAWKDISEYKVQLHTKK